MEIKIFLMESLRSILREKNITNYQPAYNGESVGLDLYYTGKETIKIVDEHGYILDENGQELERKERILIETGLKIILPLNYVGLIKDRGSISKTSLIRRAGVIDPGYTGEIFVNLIGQGTIHPGDKLPVQLLVTPCVTNFTEITQEQYDILTTNSQRKENKTGSSDA